MNSGQPLVQYFFVGPGKTGTSWLYEFISRHDMASVPTLKEPYLVDKSRADAAELVRTLYSSHERMCDFSNMYSGDPANPAKIRAYNADAGIIVTTRLPSARILSHYGFEVRGGAPEIGLARYLDDGDPIGMVSRSDYRAVIERYLAEFPRDRVLVLPLEQLIAEPETYVERLSDFIGSRRVTLDETDLAPVRVRARPRNRPLALAARLGSSWLRKRGLARTLAKLKRSPWLARALYRVDSSAPQPTDFGSATAEVERLDRDYASLVDQYAEFSISGP